MSRSTVYNNIVDDEVFKNVNKDNKELMEDFLDYLVSIDRSKTTIAQYRNDLKIFFCWNYANNDNKNFTELTKREFAKFQKHALTEWQWSSNRLAREKSTLSSLSNYIENILDDEIENYKPVVRKVESPIKQPVREKTVISDVEVQNILDTLVADKKYREACAFALAAFGGARKSELLRYKVSYFDDENIMSDAALYKTPEKIKTKGRGSKGKELIKYTLMDFKKYLDLWMNERKEFNTPDNEYIFCDLSTGKTSTISIFETMSEDITEILGRPFYFHALRHQLCSRLFRLGLPSDVIQEYFGWNSAEMLNIYNDNEASDSFGNYFTKDGIKGSNAKL